MYPSQRKIAKYDANGQLKWMFMGSVPSVDFKYNDKQVGLMGNIYFILLQKIMKSNRGNTHDNRVSLSTYKKLMIAITTSLGKRWIY